MSIALTDTQSADTTGFSYFTPEHVQQERLTVGCSDRRKEIKRRRARRQKVSRLKARLPKATKSEKVEIAHKLRELSPGADTLIEQWKLTEVDR
jgi:hypothetical protein